MNHRNAQQATADMIVRAFKDREKLLAWAARGRESPESLSLDEIKRICEYALLHAECMETSKIR